MQHDKIKINIKLTTGNIVPLKVPLNITVQSLIKQLKAGLQSQLTESTYYLEHVNGIKLANEKTLAQEGIKSDNTLIIRHKEKAYKRKHFSKLVIAIPVILILCSVFFFYLRPKHLTNETTATVQMSDEQTANGVDNDGHLIQQKIFNNNDLSQKQEDNPVLDNKSIEKDKLTSFVKEPTDLNHSEPFIIKFNIPPSELNTETRVLIKFVKDDPQTFIFQLEKPFYRVEMGPISQTDIPSLAWASGAVHIYSNEYVLSPGKTTTSSNDMRITSRGLMVMVAHDGKMIASNLLKDWHITSEPSYPLMFKVVKDVGYVYMCGCGTVTSPSGIVYGFGKDDTPEQWIGGLESDDPLTRESSVIALGYLGDFKNTTNLIKTLKDKNPLVRRSAAESLGKIGDKTAIPALQTAIKDQHSWTSRTAKWALSKIKSTDETKLIAKKDLKTDPVISKSTSLPKTDKKNKREHNYENTKKTASKKNINVVNEKIDH